MRRCYSRCKQSNMGVMVHEPREHTWIDAKSNYNTVWHPRTKALKTNVSFEEDWCSGSVSNGFAWSGLVRNMLKEVIEWEQSPPQSNKFEVGKKNAIFLKNESAMISPQSTPVQAGMLNSSWLCDDQLWNLYQALCACHWCASLFPNPWQP